MNEVSLAEYQYYQSSRTPPLEYAFHKLKIFPNGKQTYSIKLGIKIKREKKANNILHWLVNAERSARRVYHNVCDLCDCNTFEWFVTLTFTSDISIIQDRQNDKETKYTYTKWRNHIKRKHPNMKYIAIPEYHLKGGIHYHLILGNITAEELGLIFWKMEFSKLAKKEIPIYNITSWKYGWSTASKIISKDLCKNYILKYITKGGYDTRFFRQQRYSCSENLVRPEVVKYREVCHSFDAHEFAEKNEYAIQFFDYNHKSYKYLCSEAI